MKFKDYINEDKVKAWKDFETAARKELGNKWDGRVKGEHLYGGKLSKKTVDLYWKYFDLLGGQKKSKKNSYDTPFMSGNIQTH